MMANQALTDETGMSWAAKMTDLLADDRRVSVGVIERWLPRCDSAIGGSRGVTVCRTAGVP